MTITSRICHMLRGSIPAALMHDGAQVAAGELIGRLDSTGYVPERDPAHPTNQHTHIEVHCSDPIIQRVHGFWDRVEPRYRNRVDPLAFMSEAIGGLGLGLPDGVGELRSPFPSGVVPVWLQLFGQNHFAPKNPYGPNFPAHQGLDGQTETGVLLYAMHAGAVTFAGLDPASAGGALRGYGVYVEITSAVDPLRTRIAVLEADVAFNRARKDLVIGEAQRRLAEMSGYRQRIEAAILPEPKDMDALLNTVRDYEQWLADYFAGRV